MTNRDENLMRAMRRLLLRSERGSAMTEFVIGLPIFILIFIGMSTLYKLNHEALLVKAETNSAMWSKADPNWVGMVPIAGALTSVGSVGDLYQNGLSAGGIYLDSWGKAGLADAVIPGTTIKAPGSPVQREIDGITNSSGTFANDLLNDMINPTWDSSGFTGIFTSLVQSAGAGPALAAGIRYGAIDGEETRDVSHPWFGTHTLAPGKLDMPAPTAAVHRLVPVLMTRLEMNTEQPYESSTLVFEIGPDTSGNPSAEQGTACSQQAATYGTCIDSNKAGGMSEGDAVDACEDQAPPEDCGGIAGSGAPSFDMSWCTNGCTNP